MLFWIKRIQRWSALLQRQAVLSSSKNVLIKADVFLISAVLEEMFADLFFLGKRFFRAKQRRSAIFG